MHWPEKWPYERVGNHRRTWVIPALNRKKKTLQNGDGDD